MVRCDLFSCEYGCCVLPIRLVVALLLFFAIIACYGHRTALNVAITEMVVPNKKTAHRACPHNANSATMTKVQGGKKRWDEDQQSWLLSAFFPGYFLSHLPGGFVCDKWGPRWPLLIGIGISTLVTFLTPYMVLNMNWKLVVASRFVSGLGQGILYPAVTSCLQRWIPQSERSTVAGVVYAASAWGLVVGNTLTGTIVGHWESWTVVFTFWGTASVIWLSFAFMYLFSYPESHPFLPRVEEQFLQDEIVKKGKQPLPISKLLGSCPVWAMVAGSSSNNVVVFLMGTNFPKYMNNVLNYNIHENGYYSSIPFALEWFGTLLFGLLSDWLLLKMNANVALVRKSIGLFASVFSSVFLMAATYSNCDRTLAITFFSLAMFSNGPAFSSVMVNGMDLSTNHAGFLMALSNGIGAIIGFILPKIISWVAKENTLGQWHSVMWGFNTVQLFFAILFCIFGSGDRERWDYDPKELKFLQPKPKTKWYLQLPPDVFEEKEFQRMEAARLRPMKEVVRLSF